MLTARQAQEKIPEGDDSSSLVRQLVDIEILYLLTFGAKSGYELKKQLQNWFKINVSYGTLYPHLHSLEGTGLVSGLWQQKFESAPLKKRTYSLTQAGKEILRGSIESLTKIALTMQFMMTRVDMSAQSTSPTQSTSPGQSRSSLSLVEAFFEEREYSVSKSVIVNGFSGVKYPVDLIAQSPNAESKVIVRVFDRCAPIIDDILKTHVMSFDLEAKHSVILSAFKVSNEISNLAEFYHISLYSGENLESAARAMCSSYIL